jgi:glycosyltransferase involved in cell wall biosynthesis
MACARPVVVTDVGGVAGVVDRGRAGVVVTAGDVDGIAKAVIGLLRDPVRAAQLGAAGRKIVEQRYDLRSTIDAYLALCREPLLGAAG